MTIRKVHLNREIIDKSVRDFVGDSAKVAKEEISGKKIRYTVSFLDKTSKPALLFVDYNEDGTTTIEDSRGKNKEYSTKLANHIVRATQFLLYKTENLYFDSITDEQFATFSEYMKECNASITSTSVTNGYKYTICGVYGDTLYATRYNSGSILLQGAPSSTFNHAIDILSDIFPSDVILVGLTKYFKINFRREDLEKELMDLCPNLAGKLSADIVNAMLPTMGLRRAIPDGLTDYSYLCFPVLRGLEAIIKTIFKDNGVSIPTKSGFAGYMSYDEATKTAAIHETQLIHFPDAVIKKRAELLYALLMQQRHRIFHLDPFVPIFLGKNDAIDIIDLSLKTINNAY